MTIMLWIFGLGMAVELLLHCVPSGWRFRKVLAVAAVLLNGFSAGAIIMWRPNLFSALLAAINLYRAFNVIRIVEARMHDRYLHSVTRRTALTFIGLQAFLAAMWLMWGYWHTTGRVSWALLAGAQLLVAIVLLLSTMRRMRHTAWPAEAVHLSDAELPTLTVAIPARNETEDLQACLQNLIASNYPKLEILVLDDCSQNRRTPEIIRGFAHDGVRFISGEEPKETWLPKNEAYARLASEASGEYILFCGVDIRFSETALTKVIGTLLSRKKLMMSILPERALEVRRHASLAQAMRYFWELAPPRRWFRRPAVLSSCWVIRKESLRAAGGFEAATRSIVPEAHFARRLAITDSYSFMRSGVNPGVTSMKSIVEQRITAVRTRYPQLHRRPENVFILSLAELLFLAGPFALALAGYWLNAGWFVIVMAGVAAIILTVVYEIVGLATKISGKAFGLVALPFMVSYDLGILHYSMWRYEFSVVEWKGRNICIPTMHVVPHLPKI